MNIVKCIYVFVHTYTHIFVTIYEERKGDQFESERFMEEVGGGTLEGPEEKEGKSYIMTCQLNTYKNITMGARLQKLLVPPRN